MIKQTICVFKKIKPKSLTMSLVVSVLLILATSNVFAKIPETSSVQNNNSRPNGFVEVINDYESVRGKMTKAIEIGQGNQWRVWLNQGLEKNESLYWWLLSDWYYKNNNINEAYSSAVQAMLFSKMESGSCSESKTDLERALNIFIAGHHYENIVKHQTNDTRKASIIKSVARAEKILFNKSPSDGSFCLYVTLKKEKQKYKNKKNSIKPIKIKIETDKSLILIKQKRELDKFKEQVSYDKIWRETNINLIWNEK